MQALLNKAPDRSLLRAFYVQYTAVLLIVLSAMVSALVNKATQAPDTIKTNVEAPKPEKQPLMGQAINHDPIAKQFIALTTVFRNAEVRESPELFAVLQILLNHDVNAEFTIPVPMESKTEASILTEVALEGGAALERYFVDRGVPKSAVRAVVAYEDGATQLGVRYLDIQEGS